MHGDMVGPLRTTRLALFAALLHAVATAVPATTIAPPQDLGALLRMSDAVVYAQAGESWTEAGRSVPLTVTRFFALRPVAGTFMAGDFEVEELGGQFGDFILPVAGSPRYTTGRRYLLFLATAPNGRFRSRIMAYGLLVEDMVRGSLGPLPEAKGLATVGQRDFEPPSVYRRDALLDHLHAVAGGATWNAAAVRDLQSAWEEIHDDPPNCEWLLAGDTRPFRVFGFDDGATLAISPTTPGQSGIFDGGIEAVRIALAAWTNHGSTINYFPSAPHPRTITCTGFFDLADGEVVFDDPCNDIPALSGCNGTLGFGGPSSNLPSQTFGGELWHPITAARAVINNGAQCIGTLGFQEMLAHELGHTLGFGHHTDANALMDGLLHNPSTGAVLQTTDKACAAYAYPDDITGVIRRQEFAALLLRAQFGAAYTPPMCSPSPYTDVDCATTPYAAFIKDLDTRNISAGCNAGGTLFCPLDAVTREQAAMLLLKTLGIPQDACGGTTGYGDVGCSDPSGYGPWIKELRDQGITLGCNAANTLFCPKDVLTRAEIDLFFTRAGLTPPPHAP